MATPNAPRTNVVLAMTGASGAIYGARLLDVLLAAGCDVHLSLSPSAKAVIQQELDIAIDLDRFESQSLLPDAARYAESSGFARLRLLLGNKPLATHAVQPAARGSVRYHHFQDLMAPIASGSWLTAGMVVCPCSGSTLSAIATAASTNLIHRAAEVHLKERRKLIVVPRETPLSLVQLDNMRRATEAGVVVLPAMPGWYHGVTSLVDLVDFVVARICDQLGVANTLVRRWGEGG